MNQKAACLFIFLSLLFSACIKETGAIADGEFQTQRLTELMPLQPGKYITYRLDSLIFTNLGTRSEIRRYAVRYQVDSLIKDNQGVAGYRLFRWLNDSMASGPWQPAGTLFVTPYADRIEMVEDNLRSIALINPVRDDYSWMGNRYMPEDPYGLGFTNMSQWEFYYGPEQTATIGGRQIEGVREVIQSDKKLNALYDRPIVDTLIAHNITSIAGYAKNIGLVYREKTLWENQNMLSVTINPSTGDTVRSFQPYRTGFGIKMWMIDHN